MATGDMDGAGWQSVATAITVAMASGIIAQDDGAWLAFDRVRRAVAAAELTRAEAWLAVVRLDYPNHYARFVEQFAEHLPPVARR